MDIDAALKSFALHSSSCCDACAEAADRERAARAEAEAGHHGAPPHVKHAILAEHDRRIAEHERGIMTHARRQLVAEEGFMLDGPDERTDADHSRRYGSLQAAMHGAGRVRHYQAYDDGDDNGDEGSA